MAVTQRSIHPVGLQEVLSCGEHVSLALSIVSPAARYASEKRADGFQVPGLQITQETVPDISEDLSRVVRVKDGKAVTAAVYWLKRDQSVLPISLLVAGDSDSDRSDAVLWVRSLGVTLVKLCFNECFGVEVFDPLSSFPTLRILELRGTSVFNLSWLQFLTSLTALSMHGCEKIQDFGDLVVAPQLCRLSLAFTHVSNLDWVVELPLLEELDLASTWELLDAFALPRAPSLRCLKLNYSSLNSLNWVPAMPCLEELDVSYCIGVDDFNPIAQCPTLTKVRLGGNRVVEIDFFDRAKEPGGAPPQRMPKYPCILLPWQVDISAEAFT